MASTGALFLRASIFPYFAAFVVLLYKSCHEINIVLLLPFLLAGYVNRLQRAVTERLTDGSGGQSSLPPVPPPLTSSVGPVDKVAAVQAFWSRFDRS